MNCRALLVYTDITHKHYCKNPTAKYCKWIYYNIVFVYHFWCTVCIIFNGITFVSECCCKNMTCKPCLVRSRYNGFILKNLYKIRVSEEAKRVRC